MFDNYLEKLIDAIKEHLNSKIKIKIDTDYNFTYDEPDLHYEVEHLDAFVKPFCQMYKTSNNQSPSR